MKITETSRTFLEGHLARGNFLIVLDALQDRPHTSLRAWELKTLLIAQAQTGQLQEALNRWAAAPSSMTRRADLLAVHGRLCKQAGLTGKKDGAEWLEKGYASYVAAYHTKANSYPAINAASLALRLGRPQTARRWARLATKMVGERQRDFWALATKGEAAAMLEGPDASVAWYVRARSLADIGIRDLAVCYRQARWLWETLGYPTARLDEALRVPPLLVYAGHLSPRLSRSPSWSLGEDGAESILNRYKPALSWGAAACGADLTIFEMLARYGTQRHLLLPWHPDVFRELSVQPNWRGRFERALRQADSVRWLSGSPSKEIAFDLRYANDILLGTAIQRARELGVKPLGLAVWDGRTPTEGGTADFIFGCQRVGIPVITPGRKPERRRGRKVTVSSPAKAFFFADTASFSRLTEAQVAIFYGRLMPRLAGLLQSHGGAVMLNSWGDAVHAVFESAGECVRRALRVQRMMSRLNRAKLGLPEEIGFRIGLHAGPAYQVIDPITGRQSFVGSHVNRAARLEPVAQVGQVVCSEEFAALCAVEKARFLRFLNLGQIPLPKNFGTHRLYAVAHR